MISPDLCFWVAAVKVPGEKDVQKVVVDLSEPKEDKAELKEETATRFISTTFLHSMCMR